MQRLRRAATSAAYVTRALAASMALVAVAATNAVASAGVCPFAPAADASAIYLPVGVDGLLRLELSPAVPGGLGTVPVSREEVARLCIEGFDVRALDTGSLPAAMSIVRRDGRVYGNLWNDAKTPSGARVQWLRFEIEPAGYFGQGEHVPIALLADAGALLRKPPAIIGNGIIIGEVYLTPNGCGSTSFPDAPMANSQVEAFWRAGNALWGESCGGVALANGQAYRFLVAADAAGLVRYENDAGNGIRVAPVPTDTSTRRPPLDPLNAGILIASTNFCPPPCGDFAIHFRNVSGGWSTLSIDDARIVAPASLVPDRRALAFAAQTMGTQGPPQRIAFTNAATVDRHPSFSVAADRAPHCGDAAGASCADELARTRASFVVDASGCTAVAARATCAVDVFFAPQGAFAMHAKLEFADAADGTVQSIALEGFGVPPLADDGTTPAIEYFDAGLGHYFVTPLTSEQVLLDAGAIGGWKRTGEWFAAYRAGSGANAVCRYYGRPEAGLDSHFYSASSAECEAVAERFPSAWILETPDLFDAKLPDRTSGACESGQPIYRLWNALASSNHRYTTDVATRATMIAAGWIPEGYGSLGVAMCDAKR